MRDPSHDLQRIAIDGEHRRPTRSAGSGAITWTLASTSKKLYVSGPALTRLGGYVPAASHGTEIREETMSANPWRFLTVIMLGLTLSAHPAGAEKKSAPGVTNTEIKIGNTMPYSGPASALGTVGKVIAAYFTMINEKGGVNGRKLTLLSRDDGFSPPKTLEQTRRLVEGDNVAFLFATMGTAPNSAIQKYLNESHVPQLFLISSASKWNDPKNFPWSMAFPWQPPYAEEANIYLRYVLAQKPNAKFAILYENDDAGKEYLRATREVLGADADTAIANAQSFEVADPTVDSQIASLAATKADAFMLYSVTPRACSQSIRKAYELGWHPAFHFITGSCSNIEAILRPAGLEKAEGYISIAAFTPIAAGQQTNPAIIEYGEFLKKYAPGVEPTNLYAEYAYSIAGALIELLRQCGDDLTRENIMSQAANLRGIKLPLFLPDITINTSPDNYRTLAEGYLTRFDGEKWVIFGDLTRGY
jgi:ABC-type branched-subunit amino acid transport system substrate-binding protein